jgi:8-oxo-dGTP pyrophosphatase MutT (NUDIX family)
VDFALESVVARVAANLSGHRPVAAPRARAASVSVILFAGDDDRDGDGGGAGAGGEVDERASGAPARYVLIRRALRGRNAGQWALPGGKVEPEESVLDAAMREAHEEVGLDPGSGRVLGQLDDFPAKTGFAITPFVVAASDGWMPRAAADEVQAVHTFSVERLYGDEVVHWAPQPDGTTLLQMRIAPDVRVHAPTGAILLQFRELGLHGRHTPVADLTQPPFTHR